MQDPKIKPYLVTPDKQVKLDNLKIEMFKKVIAGANFLNTRNDLEACEVFFDFLWPMISRIMGDNEMYLEEQSKVMFQFADMTEKYKNLQIQFRTLKDEYEKETGKSVQVEGYDETETGSGIVVCSEGSPSY